MSSTDSSSKAESSPAKRSLVIESINPIIQQQLNLKSEIREITFYHQWTIENFSFYCLDENSSIIKYPSLKSSKFSPPSNDKLQIRLLLYPNGNNEDCKGSMSLYLHLDNCVGNEIVLNFKFWIIGPDGNCSNSYESKAKFSSKQPTWGFIKFCVHAHILEHKLTPGDVLTIGCKIDYEEAVDGVEYDLNEIVLTQLRSDCCQLSEKGQLTDVVLVFGVGKNKKEFAVHSAIFSARSEVFAAMFEHEMQEKTKRRVEITDVDAEVGQEFIEYLYCKKQFFEMHADGLLPIADKYQLHSLKSMCEDALCFRINPESVGNLLLLADMHNCKELKSKCVDYIHCHASCVLESENIMDMRMPARPELYYELFKQIPQNSSNTWSPPTLTCDPYKLSWSYTTCTSSMVKCLKHLSIRHFSENHLLVGQHYLDKHPHDLIEISSFSKSSDKNNNSSVQFSGKLYPHGENDDCKEHLSLQLQLKCDEKMKVVVKVRASIMVKGNTAKGYSLEIGKKMSNGESIGWPKFITRKELLENEHLLLNGNGQLELAFEVFYISNIDKPVTKSGVNTFADEHKFSIARDLSQFFSSQKLTDIVFVFGQKKELHAHKSIVSARSSVFARLFKSKSRVQIKNVDDVEAFEQMLALVYGQTDVLTQWAYKILPFLDKYKMDSLKKACEISLCDQLDDTNVADFLLLADKHKATMLKTKAFEYIRRKHSVLTQNDSKLKVIQTQSPKLFHELLCYKLDNWKCFTNDK